MANEGGERFLRSSYLLVKGTLYLAKQVLLREAENVHQQTGRDLDGLLKDYEQKLKHEFRHRKQREKLFPQSGKTNVENWDISLLTGVLLIVFRQSLPDVDKTAIRNIKFQRNDVYAHPEVASLDEIDYTDTCNYLKDAFNTLASRCSAAVKQECDAIIQTCLHGALDRTSLVEHLKQLAEKDNDSLVEIIAKIEPIEVREKVLKTLQQAFAGQRRIEVKDSVEDPARQIGKTEECRSEEGATGHKRELYIDAEEGGEESTQIKLTDHEEEIYMERKEPEEKSIQEKVSAHLKPMTNEGEERFLRCSYLLLKGTLYLAKQVLLREAENVHQQTGRDLDGLLKDYEQKLKHEFRHRKQREILFPPSGKTNVENWDISLLTSVLLIVFRQSLPDVDKTAIRKIKFQRNDVYVFCGVASLDEDEYTDTCNDLKDAFNILASGCSAAVKQECDAIIQTCLHGALDRTPFVEHLKQLAEKADDSLVEMMAKIKQMELREKVLKTLQQAFAGQRRIEVKVVDSHFGFYGTDEDQDNIALAENIIVSVTNEAIRRAQTCGEYTRMREIIQEILDAAQKSVIQIGKTEECRSEEDATGKRDKK